MANFQALYWYILAANLDRDDTYTSCVTAFKCKFILLGYLVSDAYGGRNYVRLQDKSNSEPSLIYHTTRGKVELEHNLKKHIYSTMSTIT